jgi:CHAD domain-containing protein
MPDNNSKQVDKMLRKFELLAELVTQMATPETVHDLRTSSRRIQTMIQAHQLENQGAGRKLLKQLHRLRTRAGKVRDIDVQLLALETLPSDTTTPSHNGNAGHSGSERDQVAQALRRSRAKQTGKLALQADTELNKHLLANLAQVGVLLETTGGVDEVHFLRAGLDRFSHIAGQYAQLDENNLHQFRKDCKHARYTLEIAGDNKPAEQAIDRLKEIQDTVGDWHDWINLAASAEKVCSGDNSPLLDAIRQGRDSRFTEGLKTAHECTKALLALRTKQFETKPPAREQKAAKVA